MKQRIIQLAVENVKKLRAVQVKPDGSVYVVGGRNGQGKSAVLDSIEYALKGKGAIPGEPVRHGETSARIVLETDQIVVIRTFTENDTYLKVTNKDGFLYTSPQAVLDAIYGGHIDPVEFIGMHPRDQARAVAGVAGIDLDDMERRREVQYQERRDANRDLKRTQAQVNPDINLKEKVKRVDVAALTEELQARMTHNQLITAQAHKLSQEEQALEETDRRIAAVKKELAELEALLVHHKKAVKIIGERAEELGDFRNTDEIRQQIANAGAVNRRADEIGIQKGIRRTVRALEKRVRQCEGTMAAIDKERDEAIAAADLPVKGLTVDPMAVRYNGVPFDQCSSSEQITVSTAIALAANPDLPVVLIREGSLLDTESREIVAKMSDKAGAQVFLECVIEDGEGADIIIEDGSAK